MSEEIFTLTYLGGDADAHRLEFYDASISYEGLSRTLAILGHYYATGEIRSQAPGSAIELYLLPPSPGSFRQQVLATVVGGVILLPFGEFVHASWANWFPTNDPQLARIAQLIEEQNSLLGGKIHPIDRQLTPGPTTNAISQMARVALAPHQQKIDVIRSITANSFQKIFRPVGRSVKNIGVSSSQSDSPIGVVTPATLIQIESDRRDPTRVTVIGRVTAFSRTAKTGVIFSDKMGRGMRFEYMASSKLQKEDIFSWSQYTQRELMVEGEFVFF